MSYYDTLAEDITRAKEILDKGRVTRDIVESLPEAARPAARMGGTIFGADVYAAYMLLESFVEAIETVGVKVCEVAVRAEKRHAKQTQQTNHPR